MDSGRKPFQPIDGATPRWQKLYTLVLSRKVGDEVTYREAIEALGFEHKTDRTLKIAQQSMREAQRHLERDGERTVSTVAKFGWVVLDAQRELQQVDRRLTKTRRAAQRVVRGARALDNRRGELSQFERARLDHVTRSAQIAADLAGRKRVDLKDIVKQIEQRSA